MLLNLRLKMLNLTLFFAIYDFFKENFKNFTNFIMFIQWPLHKKSVNKNVVNKKKAWILAHAENVIKTLDKCLRVFLWQFQHGPKFKPLGYS